MNIAAFRAAFWKAFDGANRNRPGTLALDNGPDLCPDVQGMLSLRKQHMLNLAFGLLPEDEAYFEVGTFQGKSLISALTGNAPRTVYAADNFAEFSGNNYETLWGNLGRYGLQDLVRFYNGDFRGACTPDFLRTPVGIYFYDGAHDHESQYLGIKLVEPFLADEALVFVDDWRHGPDSLSYAKPGTLQAMRESACRWQLLYELPARYNGDLALWWNGVGVLRFSRTLSRQEARI
jgi:hypothetical protein